MCNRPFPSSLVPPFQREFKCETHSYENDFDFHENETPKGRKSSNFAIILMKRTRLLNLNNDMFRQLLCHRQFTDGIKMMKNI